MMKWNIQNNACLSFEMSADKKKQTVSDHRQRTSEPDKEGPLTTIFRAQIRKRLLTAFFRALLYKTNNGL